MMERKSKYISVFHFQLIDKVKEGNEVYMLDKNETVVSSVNNLKLNELIELINIIEAEGDKRFYFWYVEEETSEGETNG